MSDQLRELIAKTLWHDGLMHVMSPEDLVDAVLALFDVEEEYGITWPPTGSIDWCTDRQDAEESLATRHQFVPDVAERTQIVWRYVLTTKPLPVEENQPK